MFSWVNQTMPSFEQKSNFAIRPEFLLVDLQTLLL